MVPCNALNDKGKISYPIEQTGKGERRGDGKPIPHNTRKLVLWGPRAASPAGWEENKNCVYRLVTIPTTADQGAFPLGGRWRGTRRMRGRRVSVVTNLYRVPFCCGDPSSVILRMTPSPKGEGISVRRFRKNHRAIIISALFFPHGGRCKPAPLLPRLNVLQGFE